MVQRPCEIFLLGWGWILYCFLVVFWGLLVSEMVEGEQYTKPRVHERDETVEIRNRDEEREEREEGSSTE